MAKTIDNEQEMHNRINENAKAASDKLRKDLTNAVNKAVEVARKERKKMLAREVARCLLTAFGIAGLYLAQIAGLISPLLTHPLYAIAFVCIGWHLCRIDRMKVRK